MDNRGTILILPTYVKQNIWKPVERIAMWIAGS